MNDEWNTFSEAFQWYMKQQDGISPLEVNRIKNVFYSGALIYMTMVKDIADGYNRSDPASSAKARYALKLLQKEVHSYLEEARKQREQQ
jgi:hypothetical protein